MATTPTPCRGEVWKVRFDPSLGDEIGKDRPAVVISDDAVGRLQLKIVVPITDWKPRYASMPWFVFLTPDGANGLSKDSGADAFQVKSLSTNRFLKHLGILTAQQIDDIVNAIAFCIGLP
jgi:mRNA interferase MazF